MHTKIWAYLKIKKKYFLSTSCSYFSTQQICCISSCLPSSLFPCFSKNHFSILFTLPLFSLFSSNSAFLVFPLLSTQNLTKLKLAARGGPVGVAEGVPENILLAVFRATPRLEKLDRNFHQKQLKVGI